MAEFDFDKKRFWRRGLFFTFLLVYFAGLVLLCEKLNVTIDEMFSLNTTSNRLSDVIKQSYNSEGQPPVYFVLLSLWRRIDSSIIFARLFSVLCVGLAAFYFYKLVRLIAGPEHKEWLIVLFLLNPFIVWSAAEIRLYAFLLFLALVSLYYFFCFYKENKNKYLLCFVVSGLIGLYTQYLYIFLLFSLGVSLLLFKGWKVFLKFCLYSLPVGALFLLGILMATNPFDLAQVNSLSSTPQDRVNSVLHAPQDLILAMSQVPFARVLRWTILAIFVLLLVRAFFQLYKQRRSAGKANFEMLSLILTVNIVLLISFSVFFAMTAVDYHDRYLTVAIPSFILLFVAFNIYPALNRTQIFAALCLLYGLTLASNYRYPVKEYDNPSLARYIISIENKNEPILFYQKVLSLPFKVYYKGTNPVVPLPDTIAFDHTYFSKIRDTLELKKSIDQIGPQPRSYLLLTDRTESYFKNDSDIKLVNDYVAGHYNVTLDTLYRGRSRNYRLRIRRLEVKGKG